MRYFVIGDDGQKYGPADLQTLQTWIGEGRLLPIQQLEEEVSGIRSAARAVNGLVFPMESAPPSGQGGPVPQGSPYGGTQASYQNSYARPSSSGDDGQQDVTLAWVFGVLGLLACCLLDIPALIFANRAYEKGHPGANAVRIFCFVVLGLQVVGFIGYLLLVFVFVKNGGGMPPRQQMPFRPTG